MNDDMKKEQVSILSSQLEILVSMGTWGKANKDSMMQTANQIKNIIKTSEGNGISNEIGKFVDILIKAKVTALMNNDSDYQTICTKFDAIISNVKKYQGGVNE